MLVNSYHRHSAVAARAVAIVARSSSCSWDLPLWPITSAGFWQDKVEPLRARPYAATFAGILLIVSPVLLARLVGLTSGLGFIVWPIAAVGFLLEYSVWTAGLGAAALVRFNRPTQPPAAISPAAGSMTAPL